MQAALIRTFIEKSPCFSLVGPLPPVAFLPRSVASAMADPRPALRVDAFPVLDGIKVKHLRGTLPIGGLRVDAELALACHDSTGICYDLLTPSCAARLNTRYGRHFRHDEQNGFQCYLVNRQRGKSRLALSSG